IRARFKAGVEIDQDCKDAAVTIGALSDELSRRLEEKEKLIEEAERDRTELLRELGEISTQCQALLYAKEIAVNTDLVRGAHRGARIAAFWDATLPDFTTVL